MTSERPAARDADSEAAAPIDRGHLARMTLGDKDLEREVLELFVRQAESLLTDLAAAPPATTAPIAHRLKGSAQGIGAWRVAREAEEVERQARGETNALGAATAALKAAALEAKAAAETILHEP